MKCINSMSDKGGKKTARQLKLHRRKVRKTIFLIAFLIIFLLCGVLGLLLYGRSRELKESQPYDRSVRAFGTTAGEESLTARGVADSLCVGENNASMAGIENREGELAGLFDIKDREIPFSQGMHEKVSPGDVTQIMTALTAYEKLNMENSVTIEQEDLSYGYGTNSLSAGSVITVRQLMNAVLVSSSDDACRALARAAAGSSEAFLDLMNAKAQELGMTNTSFVNVTGNQDEEQYTTVYDVYLLMNAVLTYQDITNAMRLSSYTMNYTNSTGDARQKWLDSDNLYVTGLLSVPKDVTVLGGKTVASDSSNYTVLLVQNNYGDAFVAIVLKADGQSSMNERIQQMLGKINS